MMTFVDESNRVGVPSWGIDLASFRRWMDGDDVPENARVCYPEGEVWIAMRKACGAQSPFSGPRYGVAFGAEICIGKVLRNEDGSSVEGSLLQGIDWALGLGCRVVSMSLEIMTNGQRIPDYDRIGQQALDNNTLLIAAAGNDSRRSQGFIAPVGSPANSPNILAVVALDSHLRVADFSNGTVPGAAGGVDIAAPGIAILSSVSQTAHPRPGFPSPGRYGTMSGGAMATPLVAGLAALVAEARPEFKAADIMRALLMLARSLPQSSADVGKGLARAPRNDDQ